MKTGAGVPDADVALVCRALGEETRLKIVRLLLGGEACACTLLEDLSITQPTLSHHMKVLMGCALVVARKDGKWTYYSLNCETLGSFRNAVDGLLCAGNAARGPVAVDAECADAGGGCARCSL